MSTATTTAWRVLNKLPADSPYVSTPATFEHANFRVGRRWRLRRHSALLAKQPMSTWDDAIAFPLGKLGVQRESNPSNNRRWGITRIATKRRFNSGTAGKGKKWSNMKKLCIAFPFYSLLVSRFATNIYCRSCAKNWTLEWELIVQLPQQCFDVFQVLALLALGLSPW